MPRLPYPFRFPTKFRRGRARRGRMATLLLLLLLPSLLLLPFYIIYKPPRLLIAYFAYRWPDVLWQVSVPRTKAPLVGLSIDDTPSAHTRDILAQLAAHGARATFFVIGAQVSEAPDRRDILREIVRGGHELGNHGMHDEPAVSLADAELEAQIKQVEGLIEDAYRAEGRVYRGCVDGDGNGDGNRRAVEDPPGRHHQDGASPKHRQPRPHWYRPGSGFFSARIRALAARLDYRIALGSIYPHDAQVSYWWLNLRHILSMLQPGGIIICHDRRSWMLPMLQRLLPELERRGYQAVTLSELLEAAET